LAAFLKVTSGLKVHIITVNDYLVQRDAEFAGPIFELVGISVGFIQSQLDPSGREGLRRDAYACDITYGTNSEFGFDYLRDNMKNSQADQVQGRLDFVIVDEVDVIRVLIASPENSSNDRSDGTAKSRQPSTISMATRTAFRSLRMR
jgi:preprotein translocase subunit SecA